MKKKYLKSQNLSKHGVENVVDMATCDTLDTKSPLVLFSQP